MATGFGISTSAGSNEFITTTTTEAFIPEIWSPLAIVSREAQLVFAKLVDRKFEDGITSGDTIHVPSVNDLAARGKTRNTPIEYETLTEVNRDITIDTHKYVAIAVESMAVVQTNRDQLSMYAGKLGYALGIDIDTTLSGVVDDSDTDDGWGYDHSASDTLSVLNTPNAVGTLGVEATYADYLRCIQYLDDKNVPADSRYFVISPAAEMGLMKMAEYINRDFGVIQGSKDSSLDRAFVGSFVGVPIYKTTQVEGTNAAGHDNAFFQKEAHALVMQMNPTMHTMYDIDFFADKVAIEQLYGHRLMRQDHAVWFKGA